jgi:lysophospholipase L1-like esterase
MNRSPVRPRWAGALLLLAGALAVTGCTAWRLEQARALARASEPYRQAGQTGGPRWLVVGDSTAVGTGATDARYSVPGLIGQRMPDATIDNRARDGATFADLPSQLAAADGRYDVVLVMAGGNDVMRLRDMDEVRRDITRTLAAAHERAPAVIVMPAGNVGNAPFFWPPLSWWMTARAREMHRAIAQASARNGSLYVNLFRERAADPFVQRPELNAVDGLHPSDAGYRQWWSELETQAGITPRLVLAAAT